MQRRQALREVQKRGKDGAGNMGRTKAERLLNSYRRASERIRQAEEELQRIEDNATSTTTKLNGMPRGSGKGDKVGTGGVDAADIRTMIADMKREAEELRIMVFLLIDSVEDATRAEILNRYYLGGETLESIAGVVHYSYRWTIEQHRRGIADIDAKLKL